ncbi:MAG TPA: hypothetical protein VGG20_18295 [Thermoanaerobaculia bacterium]|jgi:hypothetical protein
MSADPAVMGADPAVLLSAAAVDNTAGSGEPQFAAAVSHTAAVVSADPAVLFSAAAERSYVYRSQ